MKYIFSAWGINIKIDIYDCIRLASKYNFDGIMFGIKDVKDVTRVKKYLEYYRILPAIYYHRFVLCEDYNLLAKQLNNLELYASCAALLGSRAFMISIIPGSNIWGYEENYKFHLEYLTVIADILRTYNIILCLEFVNEPQLSFKYNFINTAQELFYLVQDISKENVKMVLDSYHLYRSKELYEFDPVKFYPYIEIMQLNDVVENISGGDGNRTLPNMVGNIDSNMILQKLEKIDYKGYIMVELCNRSLCTFGIEEIFCKVRKSLEKNF